MKGVFFSACAAALALAGCDLPGPEDQASGGQPERIVPSTPRERDRPFPNTKTKGSGAEHARAPVELYDEVRRFDAACVEAGGVSGSPDCDAAVAKEEQLEKLGYCVDYPNDEKLAHCTELTWRS